MTIGKRAARLAASAAFAVLAAACSGGGGGSAPAVSVASAGSSGSTGTTNSNGSSSGSSSSSNSDPGSTGSTGSAGSAGSTDIAVRNVNIGSPDPTSASAVTAQFNFNTAPPPVGTTFLLSGPVAAVTSTTVGPAGIQATSARFTYEGTVTANGTTANAFDILIPQLNVNITNVPDDGSLVAINNNTAVFALQTLHMDYNLLGLWKYVPVQGASIYGINVNGSGTPQANVPTTGSATYSPAIPVSSAPISFRQGRAP